MFPYIETKEEEKRMSKKAIIPGSFDPITLGHLDIIKRAAELFDEVIVLVTNNSSKKTLFNIEQRVALVRDAVCGISNVRADCDNGLLVDYIASNKIDVQIKGVRGESDFSYESELFGIYNKISENKYNGFCETLFMPTKPEFAHVSSTFVREMLKYGEDCSYLVPNYALLCENYTKNVK